MDPYDRARLRSVLLLGGLGAAVVPSDKDADPDVERPDGYAYDYAHSDAHAYGPHITHTNPVPGCSLCDTVTHAYADGVPERGVDDVPGCDRVECGGRWNAGLRQRRLGGTAGRDGHRHRDDDAPVHLDREEVKP